MNKILKKIITMCLKALEKRTGHGWQSIDTGSEIYTITVTDPNLTPASFYEDNFGVKKKEKKDCLSYYEYLKGNLDDETIDLSWFDS